jgi:hypothetical protein
MTHAAAVRASILFVFMMIIFGALGLGTHAPIAHALFVISGSAFALMMLFAVLTPAHRVVPVRARRARVDR